MATDKRQTLFICFVSEQSRNVCLLLLLLLVFFVLCYRVLIIMWTQSEYVENWIMPIHYYIYIGTKYIIVSCYNCHTWLLNLAMRRIHFFALFSVYVYFSFFSLLHAVCLFRFSSIFCVCIYFVVCFVSIPFFTSFHLIYP